MKESTSRVGLGVHQEEIVVAVLEGSSRKATEFRVGGDGRGVGKLVRHLKKLEGRVECAYEAGPTGYTLERRLEWKARLRDLRRTRGV